MTFSKKIVLIAALLALAAAFGLLPKPAAAQSLDRTLTDPAAIAQECGGDPNAGKPLFASCASCHALTPDQATPRGPHLAELYGRQAGGLAGYPYSAAMQGLSLTWEGESLHQLLSGAIAMPGHPVMPDEQDRRDLLTWLRLETRPAPPRPEDVVVPASVYAIKGDAAWGEYLSGDCVSCHHAAAEAQGMTPIKGWTERDFVLKMHQYKARAIGEEAMQMQAMRLSDEEIAALAAYFAKSEREGNS